MQSTDLERPVDLTERPSLQVGRVVSPSDVSGRKREANAFMRSGLEQYGASELIPFFCECRREGCYQPVWLTKAEYDCRRPGHALTLVADDHDATDMPTLRASAAAPGFDADAGPWRRRNL